MTPKDFVTWLKGFSEGVHHYNITPAQWDRLKDELKKVDAENGSHTYGTITTSNKWNGSVTTNNNCYTTDTVF